jgi:hypothetical protein
LLPTHTREPRADTKQFRDDHLCPAQLGFVVNVSMVIGSSLIP